MKLKTRTGGAWANWRAAAAVGVLLAACSPASAFYWQGWPGSLIRAEPTLITPPVLVPPPTTPTPEFPPGTPPGEVVPPPVGPPNQTPEPSTALIGLLGLGTLAARRVWKRR